MAKRLPEPRLLPPSLVHKDERGTLIEAWDRKAALGFKAVAGLTSYNKAGVLRGLHFQRVNPRALIVRVVDGLIWDVAVDIRKDSPSFGRAFIVRLQGEGDAAFIPEGFAHGFYAVEPSVVIYECSTPFDPDSTAILSWQAVEWRGIIPAGTLPIVSEKDANAPQLKDIQPVEIG